jgi:hypothetical protein
MRDFRFIVAALCVVALTAVVKFLGVENAVVLTEEKKVATRSGVRNASDLRGRKADALTAEKNDDEDRREESSTPMRGRKEEKGTHQPMGQKETLYGENDERQMSDETPKEIIYTEKSGAQDVEALTKGEEEVKRKETDDREEQPKVETPEETAAADAFFDRYERVIEFNDTKSMESFAGEFFTGTTCERILGLPVEEALGDGTVDTLPPTLVNLTFSCHDLYKYGGLGSGNYISAIYGLRMAAHALGSVDVRIRCDDAIEQRDALILPWLMGNFSGIQPVLPAAQRTDPTVQEACSNYRMIPITHRVEDMQFELRRMAIALVGIPFAGHPAEAWGEQYLWSHTAKQRTDAYQIPVSDRNTPPLYPDVELDDAVLHFRCGDLILSNHPSFGFMKFASFSRHISPEVRSIGIATQPFEMTAQRRNADGGEMKMKRCKKVVMAFVEHLEERFPGRRIRIHNNVNETIALTFARMVMANQTVVAITSFGVFPGVATFGMGYIRKPDYPKAPNRWLLSPKIESLVDNVKLVEEPRLMAVECRKMWGEDGTDVINWFQTYDGELPPPAPQLDMTQKEAPVQRQVDQTAGEQPSANTDAAVSSWAHLFLDAERVVRFNGTGTMKQFGFDLFDGKYCEDILGYPPRDGIPDVTPKTLVEINFNCFDLYKHGELGTGNYISALHGLRLAAAAIGNVDVSVTCEDAREQRDSLILPWMMGWFPATHHSLPAAERTNPTIAEACSDYKSIPIAHRISDMQFELRRMAVALVGIPESGHPAEEFAEQFLWSRSTQRRRSGATQRRQLQQPNAANKYQLASPERGALPLFPNTDLDDAVLHFRCGDLISSTHPSFGFMKFGSFSRHISPDVRSIGIATQPFEMSAQQRDAEGGAWKMERCRTVVHAFVDHLQEKFPAARVTIRNDAEETIALTFARMVMANQTVIGITSFGVFPGVATFGTSYIRKPDFRKAPNRWLLSPHIETFVDNVKLVEEPALMANQCRKMWGKDGTDVINWFRSDPSVWQV